MMRRIRPLFVVGAVVAVASLLASTTALTASLQQRKPPNGAHTTTPAVPVDADDRQQRILQARKDLAKSFDRLSELRPNQPSADVSAPIARIPAGSSYTRLWTKETWNKHASPPHRRYTRHVRRWASSSLARTILPTVVAATAWSVVVALSSHMLPSFRNLAQVTGSASMLGYLSTPLAMLLTLRANQSMSRLVESRILWGQLVTNSKSLASKVKMYLYPYSPITSMLLIRHLACLGWALKALVRGEDEDYEMGAMRTMLDGTEDEDWMEEQPHKCNAVTARIRELAVRICMAPENAPYLAGQLWILEGQVVQLEGIIGECERLFGSPISPTYTRHLSRIMFLSLWLTPVSLAGMGLSPLGIVLASMIAAYVFVGVDEVGMEIENNFQLLPLQQLAALVQNGVRQQFLNVSPKPEIH